MTKSLSLKAATQFPFNFTEEFVFPNVEIQVCNNLRNKDARTSAMCSS